mmetsp:Transcript_867/g.2227  ORF Transcript_867/g.2227 Transcript_867/m.2227 type:complete len:270 (+) Transcript_867:656-1465(+)
MDAAAESRAAASATLRRRSARERGPTPPGVPATRDAWRKASRSGSRSERSWRVCAQNVEPTETATAPGATHDPRTSPGTPAHEMTTSDARQSCCRLAVALCATVTVACAWRSECARGLPTMRERPMTSACLPRSWMPPCSSNFITASGVTGIQPPRAPLGPAARLPPRISDAPIKCAPSTSFSAGTTAYAASESMCAGSGHMSWMPSQRATSSRSDARRASVEVSCGRSSCSTSMPCRSPASPLLNQLCPAGAIPSRTAAASLVCPSAP